MSGLVADEGLLNVLGNDCLVYGVIHGKPPQHSFSIGKKLAIFLCRCESMRPMILCALMKNLLLIALFSCLTVSAAETGSQTHHIVLESGSATNKVVLDHVIDSARRYLANAFPSSKLDDYKETVVIFQNRPVVQVIYFKSTTESGFLLEYRMENGKAKITRALNEIVPDPEASIGQAAAQPAVKPSAPAKQ